MIRLADPDIPGLPQAAAPPPASRYAADAEWGGPESLGPQAGQHAEGLRNGWRIVGADRVEHQLAQWQLEEDQRLDADVAALAPGEAEGFAERAAGGYFERARAFKETLPQSGRSAIDERLARHEQFLFAKAGEIETREQIRSAREGLDASLQLSLLPAAAAAARLAPDDPDRLARLAETEALASVLIDRNPALRPHEKAARKAAATGMIHTAFAEALTEAEKLTLDPDAEIETVGARIHRLASEGNPMAEGDGGNDGLDDEVRDGEAPANAEGFGREAWLGLVRRYRPDLATGKSIAAILALRADGDLSADLRERGLTYGAHYLTVRGHSASPANLYLAHAVSPEGAVALLSADPEGQAAAIDPAGAQDRPELFYKDGDPTRPYTVGAVIAGVKAAMDGASLVDFRQLLSGVSPDMGKALATDAGVSAARATAEARLADAAAYRTRLKYAEQAIDEGGFGLAELQKAAGEAGWLRGEGDFERLFGRITQRAGETLAYDKAVSKYIDPTYRFDPASPEDQAAVDLIYERGLAEISAATIAPNASAADAAAAAQDLLKQIIEHTDIVPTAASRIFNVDGMPPTEFERRHNRFMWGDPDDPNEDFKAHIIGQYLTKDSIPAQAVKGAYSGFTLPGDVLAGRVDPASPEGIARTLDLAGLVTLGPLGAPRGALGSGAVARRTLAKDSGPSNVKRGDSSRADDQISAAAKLGPYSDYRVVDIKTVEGRSSDAVRGTPEYEALNNPRANTIYRLDNAKQFITNAFGLAIMHLT